MMNLEEFILSVKESMRDDDLENDSVIKLKESILPMQEKSIGDNAMIVPANLIRKRDRIYFKSPAGNPVRTETYRGDGWVILHEMEKANDYEFCKLHNPSIYAHYIRIWNRKE